MTLWKRRQNRSSEWGDFQTEKEGSFRNSQRWWHNTSQIWRKGCPVPAREVKGNTALPVWFPQSGLGKRRFPQKVSQPSLMTGDKHSYPQDQPAAFKSLNPSCFTETSISPEGRPPAERSPTVSLWDSEGNSTALFWKGPICLKPRYSWDMRMSNNFQSLRLNKTHMRDNLYFAKKATRSSVTCMGTGSPTLSFQD